MCQGQEDKTAEIRLTSSFMKKEGGFREKSCAKDLGAKALGVGESGGGGSSLDQGA